VKTWLSRAKAKVHVKRSQSFSLARKKGQAVPVSPVVVEVHPQMILISLHVIFVGKNVVSLISELGNNTPPAV